MEALSSGVTLPLDCILFLLLCFEQLLLWSVLTSLRAFGFRSPFVLSVTCKAPGATAYVGPSPRVHMQRLAASALHCPDGCEATSPTV